MKIERIIEIENFLTSEECNIILDAIKKYEESEACVYMNDYINDEKTHSVRGGKSIFISKIPELKEIDNLLFNAIQKNTNKIFSKDSYYYHMLEDLNSGIEDVGYEYHYYGPEDVLRPHYDGLLTKFFGRDYYGNESVRPINLISLGITLNNPEGADLIFKNQNKKIKSELGKAVLWSPDFEWCHETNKSKNGRHTIVTWFVLSDFFAVKKDYFNTIIDNQKNGNV